MDSNHFASDPSDPTWEPARWQDIHVITLDFHSHVPPSNGPDEPIRTLDETTLSERAQALNKIASECKDLCRDGASLEDIKTYLQRWEDPTSPGRIQANVLAWLNDAEVLESACEHTNVDLVRYLLEAGLKVSSDAFSNAVAQLEETGNDEIVRILLHAGWDINECLDEDTPPVLILVMEYPDLVKLCLDLGADPNVSSPNGRLIMESAAYFASLDTLKSLVDHGARVDKGALVAHASNAHSDGRPGRIDVVRFLLDHGAPVDAWYLENHPRHSCQVMAMGRYNALHFALWKGKKDMVTFLLERGANKSTPGSSPFKEDGKVMSPVEIARKGGFEDLVDLLS